MKKNVIVTGGAQGIGKIIALELLAKGYAVTVFELDEEAIAEVKQEIPDEAIHFIKVDVADENPVRTAVEECLALHGNIFALVNNAGIAINKPLPELSLAEWNRVIGTNLSGAFLCAKYTAPHLQKQNGRIINIASTRALQSEPNTEAYSASKGGILALTHALAASLGPKVKVNSISPGWIDVSAVKKKTEVQQYPISAEDHAQHPAGRVGNAHDIARMVIFLLDEKNDFITGQNFVVDGGMTTKMIYM